jgi:hypothetical protein
MRVCTLASPSSWSWPDALCTPGRRKRPHPSSTPLPPLPDSPAHFSFPKNLLVKDRTPGTQASFLHFDQRDLLGWRVGADVEGDEALEVVVGPERASVGLAGGGVDLAGVGVLGLGRQVVQEGEGGGLE